MIEEKGAKQKLPIKLESLIQSAADDINEHFGTQADAWPLSSRWYVSDVVHRFLGFELSAEILKRLSSDITVEFTEKGMMFVKNKAKVTKKKKSVTKKKSK
jgi:hypothetical protein